jgi:hypothetical protein
MQSNFEANENGPFDQDDDDKEQDDSAFDPGDADDTRDSGDAQHDKPDYE